MKKTLIILSIFILFFMSVCYGSEIDGNRDMITYGQLESTFSWLNYNKLPSTGGYVNGFLFGDTWYIGRTSATFDIINITTSIYVDDKIYHLGDVNTYLDFDSDIIRLIAGGKSGIILSEATTPAYIHFGSGDTWNDIRFFGVNRTTATKDGGWWFDNYGIFEGSVTANEFYYDDGREIKTMFVSTATPDNTIRFHAEISSYVFTSTYGAKMYIQTTKDFLHPTFPARLFEMPIIKWDPPEILSDRLPFFIGPQYFSATYEPTFYISVIDTAGNYRDMVYFSTMVYGSNWGDADGSVPDGFDWFTPDFFWKEFRDGAELVYSETYGYYYNTAGYGYYFDEDEFSIDMSTGNYGISGYRNELLNYTLFHIGDGSAAQTEDLEFQVFATSVTILHQGVFALGIDSSGNLTSGGDIDATGHTITASSFNAVGSVYKMNGNTIINEDGSIHAFTSNAVAVRVGTGAVGVDYIIRFEGENNDGDILWDEDFPVDGRFVMSCGLKVDGCFSADSNKRGVMANTAMDVQKYEIIIATSLADTEDYEVTQMDGKAGYGYVVALGHDSHGNFDFTTAGVVALKTGHNNLHTTVDNNTTLNVSDSGSTITLSNELGGRYTIVATIWYVD